MIQEQHRMSARRAWHDTYFIRNPDRLEILAQNTTLGSMISQIVWERASDPANPEYRKKLIVGSHMTLTGTTSQSAKLGYVEPNVDLLARVKRCIQSMPTEHQLFGHYFYGPFADSVRAQLQDFVVGHLFRQIEPELKTLKQRFRAICLTKALCADHYATVFGGHALFQAGENTGRFASSRRYSAAKICEWVFLQCNLDIEPRNWVRDCEWMHDGIVDIIESVERRVLGQVACVINEHFDRKAAS